MGAPVMLFGLRGIPMIQPGDDLARLLLAGAEAHAGRLAEGDVLVVTAKVVSKAEGRLVSLADIQPGARAQRLAAETGKDPRLVELILRETAEVVRARPGTLIVRHRLGFVSASAGIDRSNIGGDDETALLLPADPDRSAADLRSAIGASGVDVAVVITDSHGRAFRHGNAGVAIGVAGMSALVDLEGVPDLHGRPLTGASRFPVADLVASAAVLVAGEAAQGIPAVVIRGLDASEEPPGRAADLVRPRDQDLFGLPDADYA
ncbi:MAG TPA: coenzyme F420-0:L-glutamate ligase [Acidimicrobiales bacterium]|nr:coenzyme F420-0:L-glutamate ligase [Acidimicrobiales bacterium]